MWRKGRGNCGLSPTSVTPVGKKDTSSQNMWPFFPTFIFYLFPFPFLNNLVPRSFVGPGQGRHPQQRQRAVNVPNRASERQEDQNPHISMKGTEVTSQCGQEGRVSMWNCCKAFSDVVGNISIERLHGLLYQRSGSWGGLWTCVELSTWKERKKPRKLSWS